VAEEGLDSAYVDTRFQEMCCKRVPESVAADPLRKTGGLGGAFDGALQDRLMKVVPAALAVVVREGTSGAEDVGPTALQVGVRALA
jgi:hypothetical protein